MNVFRTSALSVCLFALATVSPAQQMVNLKKRLLHTPDDRQAYKVGPLLRRHAGASHYLVQFSAPPSPSQIQDLRSRGARITSYVPDAALMVSASDDASWDGLDLKFVGRLDELDKLSPQLSTDAISAGDSYAIVEFHSDVDMSEARALTLERNVRILDRASLLPYQLLVAGPTDQVERLAAWDEVAYIFPASADLVTGADVRACAGAITEQGPVAQYVKVGPGWPRTGAPGSAIELSYVFGQLTSKLPAATVKAEILRAFDVWAKAGNVKFAPGGSASDPRTIDIFFAGGAHGDPYAFDGPGGVLAHTFYPAPPNSEPVAGDMHLDAEENWNTGASIDLFSVVLHETGHALGLGHSDSPAAVMYPFYKMTSELNADDIAGIQNLYGAATTQAIEPTPVPAPAPVPTPAPTTPSITISSPAASSTTTASTVTASGTAAGGTGTLRITWTSDSGSGAASGSANWSIVSLPLTVGANQITFTVTDAAGKTASKTVLVTRGGAPSSADTVAPAVHILFAGFNDRLNVRRQHQPQRNRVGQRRRGIGKLVDQLRLSRRRHGNSRVANCQRPAPGGYQQDHSQGLRRGGQFQLHHGDGCAPLTQKPKLLLVSYSLRLANSVA